MGVEQWVRVAVVGYGYWGSKHVRVLSTMPDVEVVIVEADDERRAQARRHFPGARAAADLEDVLGVVDGVVVATPPTSHARVTADALRAGHHVLVEKPLATSVDDAQALVGAAELAGTRLMVGHTFEYHAAVWKLREIIRSGELGSVLYVDTARLNLGLYQSDVNVIWDLAPHDISIVSFLLGELPSSVATWTLIVDHPLDSLRVNIHGTETVLDAALHEGARVLLASTSEVYGKNATDRLDEDSDRVLGSSLKSRWSYAAAKGIDEAIAYAYWCERGLPVTMVRLFNTVGPRQTGRYGMVLPTFVSQALGNHDVTVYGSGEQTRCFSFVADVVPALLALERNPGATGKVFNLGSDTETSINSLARRVVDLLRSRSRIVHVPYAEAYGDGYEDMQRRVPDTTRARELVGFSARTSLDDIIHRVAQDAGVGGGKEGERGATVSIA